MAFPYALLLALLAVRGASAIKWENCAPSTAPVSIETVTMSPDPAVSGGNFTLALPATTSRRLEGGNVAVYVTYYGIPVHVSNEDLCSRTRCPVEVGPFTFVNTESLPYITPAGNYALWLTATDAGDSKSVLFCTKVNFRIARPGTSAS